MRLIPVLVPRPLDVDVTFGLWFAFYFVEFFSSSCADLHSLAKLPFQVNMQLQLGHCHGLDRN